MCRKASSHFKVNLLSNKLDKGDNFDLSNAILKKIYNYNIHKTTQYKPFKIFYSTSGDIKHIFQYFKFF